MSPLPWRQKQVYLFVSAVQNPDVSSFELPVFLACLVTADEMLAVVVKLHCVCSEVVACVLSSTISCLAVPWAKYPNTAVTTFHQYYATLNASQKYVRLRDLG